MTTHLDDMNVLILCGGLGTRLRQTIGESQKVMAEVSSRPFLDYQLQYLESQGIKSVILCCGYKAPDVREYYAAKSFDLEIFFSTEDSPLGTGGAISHAQQLINSDPFFVLNGDSFCPIQYAQLLDFHYDAQADASVVVAPVEDKKDYGTIELGADNRITGFHEKAANAANGNGYVNAGIYCFNRDIFSWMPNGEAFSLETHVFPDLTHKNLFGFKTDSKFYDIGTPQRYQEAQNFFNGL